MRTNTTTQPLVAEARALQLPSPDSLFHARSLDDLRLRVERFRLLGARALEDEEKERVSDMYVNGLVPSMHSQQVCDRPGLLLIIIERNIPTRVKTAPPSCSTGRARPKSAPWGRSTRRWPCLAISGSGIGSGWAGAAAAAAAAALRPSRGRRARGGMQRML